MMQNFEVKERIKRLLTYTQFTRQTMTNEPPTRRTANGDRQASTSLLTASARTCLIIAARNCFTIALVELKLKR